MIRTSNTAKHAFSVTTSQRGIVTIAAACVASATRLAVARGYNVLHVFKA